MLLGVGVSKVFFGQFKKGELRDKKLVEFSIKSRQSLSWPPLSEFSGTAPETASESDFSYLELSGVNS